jgi:lysophospholipase L1-like esterase
MSSMARDWTHYVVYTVALIVGGAFLIEIALRAGLGLGAPPLVQADSTIGYVFQADQDTDRFTNRVHINEYHQRSEDLWSRPDSTFTRILFLGDSVTWGGVLTDQSETIPEQVEARLVRKCRGPVEALNASAGSWGIGNLKAYVDRFGVFESDLVVLQIGTHDLTQPTSTSGVVGHHPSYPTENPTLALQELWVRYLWPRLQPYVSELNHEKGRSDDAGLASSVEPETRLSRNLDWLRDMVEEIREDNIPVVVVHTPNRNEVVGRTDGPPQSEHRQRFLKVVDSLQIPVLNLANGWARRSGVTDYYRDHVHLNERGNRALADTLVNVLDEHVGTLCADAES